MSELLLNCPKTPDAINAYCDGARAAIKLYAVWKDGEQLVGMGRPLSNCLDDLERFRQEQLAKAKLGEVLMEPLRNPEKFDRSLKIFGHTDAPTFKIKSQDEWDNACGTDDHTVFDAFRWHDELDIEETPDEIRFVAGDEVFVWSKTLESWSVCSGRVDDIKDVMWDAVDYYM